VREDYRIRGERDESQNLVSGSVLTVCEEEENENETKNEFLLYLA